MERAGHSHYGEGELPQARTAYERAIALAVQTRWVRREAISSHNLALLCTEQLELDTAERLERRYLSLSAQIGNTAGPAEAALVLGAVELARGDATAAESHLAQARRAAEQGSWVMLLAQTRALQGRLHLVRFATEHQSLELNKARTHLLAAIDALEENSVGWSEELDPGEAYALLALALQRAGQPDKARDAVKRGERRLPQQSTVSHRTLELGRASLEGRPITAGLSWFDERGYRRVVALWRTLAG